MDKKLPIYDIVVNDENQGVGMISLVDDPAIKVNWIKLAKQNPIHFKADKEKMMLFGPFLIPNMLIYRADEQNGEYYVRFSKEEIEKISTKFNEDLNNKNINFQHTEQKVEAFVAQNWIIDGDFDKSKNLGFDLPEGTWFGGVKIKDESFWKEKIKNDEVKGFSVEILADLELSLKNKEQIMEKQINLGSGKLKDGTEVYWDGELVVGTAIFIDEAMTIPAPDAYHILEDGTTVKTEGGMITEMEAPEMMDKKEEDMAVDPTAGNTAVQITSEEVSMMIDSRFADLMEEITKLKSLLDEKQKDMETFKTQVNEKFSSTPGTESVKKQASKVEDRFSKVEARIREFARAGKA